MALATASAIFVLAMRWNEPAMLINIKMHLLSQMLICRILLT